MHCSLESAALLGLEAIPVLIEVDVAPGLPGFGLVGLPDTAVREARERVFSALKNSGYEIPSRRITVNLAPGDLRKEGTGFDLPMALGILLASGQIPPREGSPLLIAGELALDGSLRPVRGVLNLALGAKERSRDLLIPAANVREARRLRSLKVFEAVDLRSAVAAFCGTPPQDTGNLDSEGGSSGAVPGDGGSPNLPLNSGSGSVYGSTSGQALGSGFGPDATPEHLTASAMDLADIRGQVGAKRALEVAAGGGHHLLLVGSPGCGKSLLARCLPGILPPLSEAEALETSRIYSAAGLLGKSGAPWMSQPPYRAPHAGISPQALIGGGRHPRPGEISLAHNGVLFLDELPEFPRIALEALRQPLEDGSVWVSRLHASCRFPARFMLMAAMNPCPCGYLGDPRRQCRCDGASLARYRMRLSGPLVDRFDLQLEVAPVSAAEFMEEGRGERSAAVAGRVAAMRERQRHRFQEDAIHCNGQMGGHLVERHCRLSASLRQYLREAADHFGLSARSCHKVLKVARTLADGEDREALEEGDLAEALHYRVGETLHKFTNS